MSETFVGLLLAAGRSTRMGRQKLLLPWPPGGSKCMVQASFEVLASVCTRVVVVTDSDGDAIRSLLTDSRAVHVKGDGRQQMFDSVCRGLEAVKQVGPAAGVFMLPADSPGVSPTTMRRLNALDREGPDVVIPTWKGKGGHPVRISSRIIDQVLSWSGEGGLQALWKTVPERVIRVETGDSGVTQDLDFPEDYERIAHPDVR